MRAKEIAWERLVSSKESFALMVEEKEGELGRLRTALMEAQDQHRSLQGVLVDKEETLAKNNRDDVNEEQYQRRIEKLERLVLELQTQATKQAKLHESQVRDHAGQIEKIRREVVESENMIVTLEGECEELRRAGLETLNACQNTVHQIEDQKVALGAEKDKQIEHLNRVIEDLRRRQSVLFGDDDMDYRDDEGDAEWEDQRRRMEEQLELATTELENERLQVKHGKSELDKLRQQMAQQQITSASSDERVANLKRELEKEVDDKRRLIEEADAAFEAQARAEDENYEMKLSRVRMENELTEAHRTIEALQSTVGASEPKLGTQTDELQRALETSRQAEERLQKECERLQEISKQSEQECMRLMDELLQLEKGGSEDEEYKNSFKDTSAQKKLEKELADTQHRYTALELSKRTEISQLSKELADLEALVESKVFGEGDLEESLELERKRVADLEKQLAAYRSSTRNLTSPVSPITRTSQSLGIDKDDKDDIYCELCEEAGHDIIDCHAYISEISDKTDSDQLRMYCDNCDEHGFHKTEDCPNQDETF
ncbi:hypothetical protein CLU79DRAFT_705929 [Phycomyces nitens]|nr:hypothetical protein CLU79DRAFT_705929 [Phycomyces nitens]